MLVRNWSKLNVCVTGGAGFLGRAVCARLAAMGPRELFVPRRAEYDLTDAAAVARMYRDARPDVVIHLAADVGGIGANQRHPGRFFYANMAMGLHLIEGARAHGVRKFVQVGTVCAYPKHCPTPFREADLWSGYPEETNAPYGIAKRALLTMLQAYRAEYGLSGIYLLPVNLYGPADNFDEQSSHVIPALIRKFCDAIRDDSPVVTCWGTGEAGREFLFVDDAADGILRACEAYDGADPVNLGSGSEISIASLAARIAELTGFAGSIQWDPTMPDGQPRRRLDTLRAERLFGWHARTPLEDGLRHTIDWWLAHNACEHVTYAAG